MPRLPGAVAGLYGFLVVALVAGSAGGYRATTWGWTALVTLWIAAVALLVRERVELRRLGLLFVCGLTAFGGWVALSNFWTPSVPSTMQEVQRNLAYIGVVAAGLLLVRASTTTHLLGGVLVAIVLLDLYGLGTRLLPDRLGTFDSVSFNYRLAPPITYWNGLGIFTVMGIILALGFATRGRHLITRAAAGAALPILATTMYFTFSRGSWFALGAGLIAAVAIDPRRLQLIAVGIVLAPWPAFAIASADGRVGLTTRGSTIQQATADGHDLVPVLVFLAVGAAIASLAAALIERHICLPDRVRYGFAAIVLAVLVASFSWVWVAHASPLTLAERGWNAFRAPPTSKAPPTSNDDVSARLLTFSSNGRLNLWRVSLDRFRDEPLLGDGAGTYWQAWARDRDITSISAEGHSLYMETLGELGIAGLALLVLALAAPAVAAFGVRARPLVPAAFGAYAAWLGHAGIDWDWELTGVTSAALLCDVALCARRETGMVASQLRMRSRLWSCVALVALAGAAVPGLMSELALDSANAALQDHRAPTALIRTRTASRWAPWASEPYIVAARAYIELGDRAAASGAYRAALRRDRWNWLVWASLSTVSTGRERRQAQLEMRRLNPRAAG